MKKPSLKEVYLNEQEISSAKRQNLTISNALADVQVSMDSYKKTLEEIKQKPANDKIASRVEKQLEALEFSLNKLEESL